MALKGAFDSLEAVPEGLREHYGKAADGKFRPVIEGGDGWAFENVTGLRSSLEKERAERERLGRVAKAFDGLDADTVRSTLEKFEQIKDAKPDAKAKEAQEARERDIVAAHAKELKKAADRAEALQRQLESTLVDNAATEAISKHKGVPALLLPHVRSRIKVSEQSDGRFVARVVDEKGNPRVTQKAGSSGDMSIEELVEAMKSDDTFGRAFEGSGAAGSGTAGARGAGGAAGRFAMKDSDVKANPRAAIAMQKAAAAAGAQFELIEG